MQISIVIPVCDEVDSLEPLHRQLCEATARLDDELEFVFVDDGSTDGSWGVIRKLAGKDHRVRGLRFRTNYGKAAALTAGFDASRGELVFSMDADLQDDPQEIPRFLDAISQGFDVISGWKQVRHDPWHKVFPSRVFNWMVSKLTGVKLHDHNCGFKCYRREALDDIHLYGGMYRFAMVLAAAQGYKVAEVVVHHRRREFGHSHYGVSRLFKGLLDLVTVWFRIKFGDRPQYFFGPLAALSALCGLMGWYFGWNWIALATSVIAVQLFVTGLLADVLSARIASRERSFSIVERLGEEIVEQIDS